MKRQRRRKLARLILVVVAALAFVIYPGFGQNNGNGNLDSVLRKA
jgi:hypothetical protein